MLQSAKAVVKRALWSGWDAWHDVETIGFAPVNKLTAVSGNSIHAVNYEPFDSTSAYIKELGVDYRNFGFIDFGSGKGRALLEAAAFPFKWVKGVEFTRELHDIAERNIRQYRMGRVRCSDIRSVLCDAENFDIPTDPLVIFFFNPFTGPVMEKVIANIEQSYRDAPRDIFIIYAGSLRLKDQTFERIAGIEVLSKRRRSTVFLLPG